MNKLHILDTTLRDGSYAINFSFTSAQTAALCQDLEKCNIPFIEIGHGVGLGATRKGLSPAIESDEAYLKAARQNIKKAAFGMFCIPGIADLDDLSLAADHGMNFVRVGTDVDKTHESEKFIKKAKQLGMLVAANYMKSYVLPEKEFAKNVKYSEACGADIIYIVDSAGGMFFDRIQKYFNAVKEVSALKVGFHGHDNLGLAVSNSLEAARIGFDFIDASLQGMGRSLGNASLELLLAALIKSGIDPGIDFLGILKLGPKHIQPIWMRKGIMPLDVVSGFAEFHSSYMPHILRCSSQFGVDPALLIIEACKVNKISVNVDELNAIAKKLQTERKPYLVGEYGYSIYVGGEQEQK